MQRHRVVAPQSAFIPAIYSAVKSYAPEVAENVGEVVDDIANDFSWIPSAKDLLGFVGGAAATTGAFLVDKLVAPTIAAIESRFEHGSGSDRPRLPSADEMEDVQALIRKLSRTKSEPEQIAVLESFANFPASKKWSGRSTRMYKRSRQMAVPVATTSSVNFETAQRSIMLSGREFFADVKAAATTAGSVYSTVSQLLRPTDSDLFSWLCGIAKKFEEFKFTRLRFIYEPQCPSTTSGSVALFFDGDPTHIAPGNWNNLINTGANTHGAPWAKHVLDVPPHLFSSRRSYYTLAEFADSNASSTTVTPTDPLEYFPGIFGYATEGVTAAAAATISVGKVYLEYSVALRTQNTEGYNVTSLTNTVRSGEIADNSGIGQYFKLTSFPIANGFLFGGTPIKTSVKAGSEYFKVNSVTGTWTAVQNINVLCTLRMTSAGNIDTTFGVDLKWALTLPGSTTALTGAALAPYIIQGDDVTPSGTDVSVQYMLNIPKNSLISLTTVEVPVFFHMYLCPFTFQLTKD